MTASELPHSEVPVVPPRILLGPGPSTAHPRVLQAMMTPMIGYLDPDFVKVMDEVSELLRLVFETEEGLTLSVSGTGSAGMEVGINSLLEPGDTVIMCVCGFFGHRMKDMAERIGANVVVLESEWGKPFPAEMLEAELRKHERVKLGHHRSRGDVYGRPAAAPRRGGACEGARCAVHGRRGDLAGR